MLGGFIGDLAAGDVFEPVEYVLTAFMVWCEDEHGVKVVDGHARVELPA